MTAKSRGAVEANAALRTPSLEPVEEAKRALELGEPGDPPRIDGETFRKLTDQMRNVVEALYDAGPDGLGTADLITKSGEDHAVDIVRNLPKRRAEWAPLIDLPGVSHGKYRLRIAWPEENPR